MIRTAVVELSTIPGFAYKQKLPSGGAGIVILRVDAKQPGIAGISKTSGEAIPTENTQASLFPIDAFNEAIELTKGLPYKKQPAVKLVLEQPADAPEVVEEDQPKELTVVDSADYQAIVKYYPYDNACIESFHSLIKREWLSRFRIENRAHAYRLVFEYIEAFYNTVRIHSHCGYMSPDQFEKLKANVA